MIRRLLLAAFVPLMFGVNGGSAGARTLSPTTGSGPAAAPATTGKSLPRFAPTHLLGSTFAPSLQEAVALAQHFDLITALYYTLPPSYVSAMKAANPKLVILVYMNVAMVPLSQGPGSKYGYPAADYLYDAAGNLIRTVISGTYVMDPSNSDWTNRAAGQCTVLLRGTNYDGCLVDILSESQLSPSSLTAMPVHASGRQVWSRTEWLAATTGLVAAVRAANPRAPVAGSGLLQGSAYFDSSMPTSVLLRGMDLGQAESWMRQPIDSVNNYRTESQWKQDVDMLVDAESRQAAVLASVKLWVDPTTVTPAQVLNWHKYALASFLLGAGGHSYFNFSTASTDPAITADSAYDHTDIGLPLAHYVHAGSLYERFYSGGVAIVNPTPFPLTVRLGGTYTDLDGVPRTTLSLAANTGEVLKGKNPLSSGYRAVASDGGVFTFGDGRFFGSTGAMRLNKPIVAMTATPDGGGYWMVASDGGVFAFGDAGFFGSTGAMRLNRPIVAMAATPDGGGYWLVASDGGVFAFGDAGFFGSTGAMRLSKPVVAMTATPDGGGYWMVASDGGVFAFGDAAFHGSTGAMALNRPIVAGTATSDGAGYWLVASDGGVFSFGDAGFLGSTGAMRLNQPIVAVAATPDDGGYWMVASDGGIFTFGDAGFYGSTGAKPINQPIVAIGVA